MAFPTNDEAQAYVKGLLADRESPEWERFFQRIDRALYWACWRRQVPRREHEDQLQDIRAHVVTKLGTFRGSTGDDLVSWVTKVACGFCFDS